MHGILEFFLIFLKVIPVAVLVYVAKLVYDEMRMRRMYKAKFNSFVSDYRMRTVSRKNNGGKF